MSKLPKDYVERVYAGIVGKAIGVRYGAPIEQWGYEGIKDNYGDINDYVVDYNKYDKNFAADDDTNGPMFFLRALQDSTYTSEITAEQMGLAWLNYAPFEHGFYWWGGYGKSTEHTAYLNLRSGIMAPRSGSIEQNGSAVAEQIGGQIFIDTWGLIAPNNPKLAAEYAEKAASVSHDGNGKYGGMFIAAIIAAAFGEKDIYKLIDIGLEQIPTDCEYTRMVREVIRYYKEENSTDWRTAFLWVRDNFGYHLYEGTCHIIPNSAVIILSLLFGEGDYTKTINICNMCGWDTDCNVGNIGTIMGVRNGLEGIEYRWRKPINDFIACSSVIGSLNIMDLPWAALYVSDLGYKIANEKMEDKYAKMLSYPHAFTFTMPGSTHGMRTWADCEGYVGDVENTSDTGREDKHALKATFTNIEKANELRLYHRTYYRPYHFYDSRYDPCFSPILYPGQRVNLDFKVINYQDVKSVSMFIKDGNSGELTEVNCYKPTDSSWKTLSWDIPKMSGVCIEEVGVKIVANDGVDKVEVLLDEMYFSGKPDYTLDFTKEKLDIWHGCHIEVSQFTFVKGLFTLEKGELSAACSDFAEAYTGENHWKDYSLTATIAPQLGGHHAVNFRVQGAIRSYALALCENNKLCLMKNENGYKTLVCLDYNWECMKDYTFKITVCENNIKVYNSDNQLLIDYTDNNSPYLTGQIGVSVLNGSHCHYKNFIIE